MTLLTIDGDDADAIDAVEADDMYGNLPDGCGCAEVWEWLSDRRSRPE